EQVVELLVRHDRLIAAGLGALVDRPAHHWVTHGRDPFDLSRLHVRARRRTRVESRVQCRRMTWTVTEDRAPEATNVARSSRLRTAVPSRGLVPVLSTAQGGGSLQLVTRRRSRTPGNARGPPDEEQQPPEDEHRERQRNRE